METDHTRVERVLLDEALQAGAVALDAGCGRTTRLRDYRDRITRLVGVDTDEAAGRENPFLDEFVPADLDESLPFDEDSFDLVYANFVVEHLKRPERSFAEWRQGAASWRTARVADQQPCQPIDGSRGHGFLNALGW